MPLGTNNTTVSSAGYFVPEQWSDEVIAAYKTKLVLGNLVKRINFKGKKGDTIHLPVPSRGSASTKTQGSQVTLVADSNSEVQVLINKWYEYSKLYEDIAEMQAHASMRQFYTEDGGYALAKQVDQHLMLLGHYFQSGNTTVSATNAWETAKIGGDGSTAFSGASTGNGTALTDAGLRKAIQTLEDADIDSSELSFVIPPVEANVLRGISRFTEQAFVGSGDAIKTGRLGSLYGVEVFTSPNCPWIHVDGDGNQATNFSGTALTASMTDAYGLTVDFSGDTDTEYRACLLFHKESMILAEQQSIRTQAQYKQEYLGTLVTSDTVYGTKTIRDYAGIALIVPA
jgi:N4-gp56 family major capsid protein